MTDVLSGIRSGARQQAGKIGVWIDRVSHGRITPDMITMVGLAMHLPIALLIANGAFFWAAGLLVVFGLFDILDGGLARAQGKASARGMLLDASTDRFKEVMLYTGSAYFLASGDNPQQAVWAAAAAGASVCVSYVKAKGEAAVASGSQKIAPSVLNRMFSDGILTFEIRMAVMVAGLLIGRLLEAVAIIALLSAATAIQRLVIISRRL